jgi:hypothetical protein
MIRSIISSKTSLKARSLKNGRSLITATLPRQRVYSDDIPTPAQDHPATVDVDENTEASGPNATRSWEMLNSTDPAHVHIDAPGRIAHDGIGDVEKGQEMEEEYFEKHPREKKSQASQKEDSNPRKRGEEYANDDKGTLRERYMEREDVGVVEEEENRRMSNRG